MKKDDGDRTGRSLRVKQARVRGIRIVPENPDPRYFPPAVYACALRPMLCSKCVCECGHPLGRPNTDKEE